MARYVRRTTGWSEPKLLACRNAIVAHSREPAARAPMRCADAPEVYGTFGQRGGRSVRLRGASRGGKRRSYRPEQPGQQGIRDSVRRGPNEPADPSHACGQFVESVQGPAVWQRDHAGREGPRGAGARTSAGRAYAFDFGYAPTRSPRQAASHRPPGDGPCGLTGEQRDRGARTLLVGCKRLEQPGCLDGRFWHRRARARVAGGSRSEPAPAHAAVDAGGHLARPPHGALVRDQKTSGRLTRLRR